MAKKQTKPKQLSVTEYDNPEAVAAWLNSLEHPLKPVVEAIRTTILASAASITEGIKWNTGSFYCHGWFATIGTRAKNEVLVVLHHGAKAQRDSTLSETINDPSQLLDWLAKDRATITFSNLKEFKANQIAFKKIIKQWVKFQEQLQQDA